MKFLHCVKSLLGVLFACIGLMVSMPATAQEKNIQSVKVAAASDLKFAMEELASQYE